MKPLLLKTVGQRAAPPGELRHQRRRMTIERDLFAKREAGDDRIPICITSEEPYERWWGVEILGHEPGELDMQYCEQGLAFCADHDTTRQIGVIEDIKVGEDKKLRGMARKGNHPDAEWLWKDMLENVRWGISGGYYIEEYELVRVELNPDDETDARYFYRVTKWTLIEASTVAAPADTTVGVSRSANPGALPPAARIPDVPIPRNGEGAHQMDPKEKGAPAASPAAGPTADEIRAQAKADERTRIETVKQMCKENDMLEHLPEVIDLDETAAGKRLLALAREKQPKRPAVTVGADRAVEKPWENPGDFFRAVIDLGRGKRNDPRLAATRAASGMGESVGSEGGFLVVPPQVLDVLIDRITGPEGGEVLRRVNELPITVGNGTKVRGIDETSRANGSRWGGISVTYGDEGGTIAGSKPKPRMVELNLKKAVGSCNITEEMLEDSPMAAKIIEQGFSEEFTFVIEDMIFNGLGAGTPLGIMNSGALITQTKEAAQAANTINIANVTKMYARYGGKLSRGAWFVDQSSLPQLMQMTVGQQPVFLAPGYAKDTPNGALLGLPLIFTEYNAALSSLGDIVLADFGFYLFATKGGLRSAQSMHVRFLQDEQVLKFVHRHDGQPAVNSPLTPKNGGPTRSPFITLEAR